MCVNLENKFFAWLSAKVSAAQLSEFYIVYKEIESFCIRGHILTTPLFETTDLVLLKGVCDTINSNRKFQFKHFRQLGKMRKMMEYYILFLRELQVEKNKLPKTEVEKEEYKYLLHASEKSCSSRQGVEATEQVTLEKDACVGAMIDMNRGMVVQQYEADSEYKKDVSDSINVVAWSFECEDILFDAVVPISISYFGEEKKVDGWGDAFTKIICFLQEDYPSIIRGIVGYRFGAIGKVVMTGRNDVNKLVKAVEIKNGLFHESDCTPYEVVAIVRVLMDKCNVDYENIKISFIDIKNEGNNTISMCRTTAIKNEKRNDENTESGKRTFEKWLIEQVGLASRSAQSYSSAVNVAGQYSVRLGLSDKELYCITDSEKVYLINNALLANSEFAKLNESQHNRYRGALLKYWDYCKYLSNGKATTDFGTIELTSLKKTDDTDQVLMIDPEVKKRYTEVLVANFDEGFRPSKAIDRNRFRMYYNDLYGEELSEDDELLVKIVHNIGTFRNERIFAKDESEQVDLIEQINETIMRTLEEGASCIYLECLFAKYQDRLAEMLHVYNVDSMEGVLLKSGNRKYFKRYNYLFGYSKEPAPQKDVVEYMKKFHLPITYSEIEQALWYIPLDRIKYLLVTTPGIVNVASEAYLYAPNLPVSETEIHKIGELISNALLQRSFISDVELMQLIEEQCPSVLMNTPDYPMWGLRNELAYLLRDRFSFRGAIISDINEEISMAEVFSDFCQRSVHTTVDELKNFASELNTVIYWDSVYGEMVRVNQNEFIRREQIHFDIEQTDYVLDSLIQGPYTPIKSINLFLHFPAIEVPWNNFVLESYVANYSKKFRLLHASYTATDCCGAMVRQESVISDYRSLIVDVLSKNTAWKNKKDALQLLVDLGYQQRRSYSDIEKVMQEAKARMSASKK